MAPLARDHPVLASDVKRSWIGMAIWVPIAFGLPIALILLFDRDSLSDEDVTRVTIFSAWAAFCAIFTVLTMVAFRRADGPTLTRWLRATRGPSERGARIWWSINGGGAVWWALAGATFTMYALVSLATSPTIAPALVIWMGVSVVVGSAVVIVVSFAVLYARTDAESGGFDFPGGTPPRFADYVYLAIQVSTTFGGSDVDLTTTRARRVVSLQSVIAFTFNTVLVALFVSVLLRGV
jgi:uncharacterized membrane protein